MLSSSAVSNNFTSPPPHESNGEYQTWSGQHSSVGRSRQSSSIGEDIIEAERHGSTDSFVSARGFPSATIDSRGNRSASYDDTESYRTARTRRTSSVSSIGRMWRSWIFGNNSRLSVESMGTIDS